MARRAILTDEVIDASLLLDGFVEASRGEGAVASFLGLARSRAMSGGDVSLLRLERHPQLTQLSLDAIVSEGAERFQLAHVLVKHRWGSISPGEVIVFVATSARHRRDALNAVDYLMDCLKSEAIFWKKEEGADGSRWIEPTDEDRASLARWE